MSEKYFSERDGRCIALSREIARGGEGIIYLPDVFNSTLAKIYITPPDAEKANKLRAMISVGDSALRHVTAWPEDILLDAKRKVRGFLMPRVVSNLDIHKLYSPKSRASEFPQADLRFLLHVSANLCRAFATVHNNGQIIGDINHGSTLVGSDGRVTLIDTDSFEIHAEGKKFSCDVASPLFTAPELQHVSNHRGVARTQSQDNFGLAILIFHMMFMGRHPFAGVPTGSTDIPIERAIRERRFPYGSNAVRQGLTQPPGTLALATFGPDIASQFEKAFLTENRPTAEQWFLLISKLNQSLKQCAQSASHFYPQVLPTCPWCGLERATGARLFGFQIAPSVAETIDVASLWRLIEQSSRPSPDPDLPDAVQESNAIPARPATRVKQWRRLASIACIAAGLAACSITTPSNGFGLFGFGLLVGAAVAWPRVDKAEFAKADARLTAARASWEQLKQRWNAEASIRVFDAELAALRQVRAQLSMLPAEKSQRLAMLNSRRQEDQKHRHLDRYRIDAGNIPGIGPGRAAKLASFGIETADDVGPAILRISGFGPALYGELETWKRIHESSFRFNPHEPIAAQDIAALDSEFTRKHDALIAHLRSGPGNLARLNQEISAARTRLLPVLITAWTGVVTAKADRAAA